MSNLKDKVVQKAVAAKPQTIGDKLNLMAPQFNKIMPGFLRKIGGAEALGRIALNEVRRQPRLAQCSWESLAGALMTCAQTGLLPGPQRHCYLIPYGQEVQFQFDYRGMIELVRRSGELATIMATAVYEGDDCEIDIGACHVRHPYNEKVDKSDPTKIRFVYAKAVMKDGSVALEVMNRAEIDAIRKRSQASSKGRQSPWDTDWEMMARKTVLKRLCTKGQLPLSLEMQKFVQADESVRRSVDAEPVNALELPPIAIIPSTDGVSVDESEWKQTEMIQTEAPAEDIFGEVANG